MTAPVPGAPRGALRWGEWIAVVGSVVTIGLTISNAFTRLAIDKAQQDIERRRTELEASKERVERYKFALSTLTGLTGKDSTERALALGITRLALDSAEAEALFAGFVRTEDTLLRDLGRRGAAQQTSAQATDAALAASSERQGYQLLIKGDLAPAAEAFEAADRAYPTFHQAYELGRFVRARLRTQRPPDAAFYRHVLDTLSMFATPNERTQLAERAQVP